MINKAVINYPKIIIENNPEVIAAKIISQVIAEKIAESQILLLLSGGSTVKIYPFLLQHLNRFQSLERLAVSLIDERWDKNPVHAAANWPQIIRTGLPELVASKGGKVYQILQGNSLVQDTDKFNKFLLEQIKLNPYIISLQGIGPDGHTAGIFPAERKIFNKIKVNKELAFFHHQGPAGQKERISVTPEFISRINRIILFAKGLDKLPVLETVTRLWKSPETQEQKLGLASQYPVLLAFAQNCTIITDQKIAY